jgi:tetratricopeptide (TPR) repeat protein
VGQNATRLISIKLACSYVQQNNLAAAEPLYIQLSRTSLQGWDGEALVCFDDLADAYASVQNESLKETCLKHALTIKEKFARAGDGEVIRILNSLFLYYHLHKRNADAEAILEKEIALLENHDRSELGSAMIALAGVERNLNHFRKSLYWYNKVFSMWEIAMVNRGEKTASTAREIASIYLKLNEHQNAESWIEKAIIIRKAGEQLNSIEYCRDLNVYGRILEAKMEFSRAYSAYAAAFVLGRLLLGNTSKEIIPFSEGMSRAVSKQGAYFMRKEVSGYCEPSGSRTHKLKRPGCRT